MKKPSISAFFPAFNEAGNIRETIETADSVLRNITDTYEIMVIDDGSRDETGKIVEELAHDNPRIRAIHHPVNLGYGAAVWTGIQNARFDLVFYSDADLQFKLEEISNLLEFIPEYRVVIGYRSPRRDPAIRLLNAWGWNRLVRLLFGLKVKDVDCAFKLFDRQTVASLPLVSRGATMSAEMLVRLMKQGVAIKEVPVSHLPRKRGRATGAKISVIIRAFKELFSLYLNGKI